MKLFELEMDGRNTIKFSENLFSTKKVPLLTGVFNECTKKEMEAIGGILRKGEWAWMAHGKMLRVISLRNSQIISTYEFSASLGYEENCCIKSVEELFLDHIDNSLLGILIESVECKRGTTKNYICVYSVMLTTVLSTIDLPLRVTCIKFVGTKACRRNILQNFDGCIAVGTMEGILLLVDLSISKTMSIANQRQLNALVPHEIVNCNMPVTEIHRTFRSCQQEGIQFILKMEIVDKPTKICSIRPIDEAMGVAIGLEDGRLIYCDLIELQIIYIVATLPNLRKHPVIHITYLKECRAIEPCIYLWAICENCSNLFVVMYILKYKTWKIDMGADIFETFEKCSIGFQMRLDVASSYISCQALKLKLPFNSEAEYHNICAFSWFSHDEEKNKILIFDLTMYYQEGNVSNIYGCDNACKWDGINSKYLSHYILNGSCKGYDIWLNPATLTPFRSPKSSYENTIYPNSISFDCSMLHHDGCRRYNWEGAQSRFINILRTSNASIFFEYRKFYHNIIQIGLCSQQDILLPTEDNRKQQYEVILSTALEYNCTGLLRDCAKCWIEGSFMGKSTFAPDLSLSTLTDWAWKTFKQLRECCENLKRIALDNNALSSNILNTYSPCHEELLFKSRQMKLLSELFQDILFNSKHQIPERVFLQLKQRQQKMHMLAHYYNLLLWLINIGILSELHVQDDVACNINRSNEKRSKLVIYPYIDLRDFYKKKRADFAIICNNCIVEKTGNCRLLYIDYLLEYQCKIQSNKLLSYWYKGKGEPVYPPYSIQSAIDIILIPDIAEDIKYAVLLYFLLDLNMAIDETQYKDILVNLIKFPSVFKLSPQLIKTVQSFWNLDHGQFVLAIDEFISPFNKDQKYERWHIELLLQVLLTQNASHLALRLLETQSYLIMSELKLKILLNNDLISEAFHFVRSKNDRKLLELFFTIGLNRGQFDVIRNLALTDLEGSVLQNVLKTKEFPGIESLHCIYLLQKSKYLEAVTYLDELSNVKTLSFHLSNNYNQVGAPNLILSAFNTTLTPVTQNLTDVYFKIKNKIKQKELNNNSPLPFSCQLSKQNANNLLGGIYHSSALSTHFATYYWDKKNNCDNPEMQMKQLMNSNNAPFLRPLQIDGSSSTVPFEDIKYPTMYKITEKRTFTERKIHDNSYDNINDVQSEGENPCKRRRLTDREILPDFQNNGNNIYRAAKKSGETYTIVNSINDKLPGDCDRNFSANKSMEVHVTSKTTSIKSDITESNDLPIKNDDNDELINVSKRQLSEFSNKYQIACISFKKYASQIPQKISNEQSILNEYLERHKSEKFQYKEYKYNFNRESDYKPASDDDHYSPINFLNISAANVDSHINNIDLSELTKQSLVLGPQSRKPLSRLSVESDKILKSHSKSPQYSVNASKANIFTSQTVFSGHKDMSKAADQPVIEHLNVIKCNNISNTTAKSSTSGINLASYYSEIYALQTCSPKIDSLVQVSELANNFIPETKTTIQKIKTTEFSSDVVSPCRDIEINQTAFHGNRTSFQSGFSNLYSDHSQLSRNNSKLNKFVSKVSSSTISKTPLSNWKDGKLCDDTNQRIEHSSAVEDVQIKVKNAEKTEAIQDETDLLFNDFSSSESNGRTSKMDHQCITQTVDNALLMDNARRLGNSNKFKNNAEDVCIIVTSSSSSVTNESLAARHENENGILLSGESSYIDSKYTVGNYDNESTETNESLENFNKNESGEFIGATDDDIDAAERILDTSVENEAWNTKEYEITGMMQNVTSSRDHLTKTDELEKTSVLTLDTEEKRNPSVTNIEKILEENIEQIEKEINISKRKAVGENMTHVDKRIVEIVANISKDKTMANVEIKAARKDDIITINKQSVAEALISEKAQFKILERREVDMLSGEKEIIKNIATSEKSKDIVAESVNETYKRFSLQADDKEVLESIDHKVEDVRKYSKEKNPPQQAHEQIKVSVGGDNVSKEKPNYIVKTDNEKTEIEKKTEVARTNERYGTVTKKEYCLFKQKAHANSTNNNDGELINENFIAKKNDSAATDQLAEQKSELTDKLERRTNVTLDQNVENLVGFQGYPKRDVNVKIHKPYFLRGSSEPPLKLRNNLINSEIFQVRSEKRCDSLPLVNLRLMLGARIKTRAASVHKQGKKSGSSASPTVPSKSVKVLKRRHSSILESIPEDSPSYRTRSRLRLSSLESEADSVDQRQSKSNLKMTDITQGTPKRHRRNSSSSTEVAHATSNILRSSSVFTLVESEDVESIPPTPTSSNKRRSLMKRKNSVHEISENSEHSPSLSIAAMDNSLYPSERRVTRNQRALLEKSNVLAQNLGLDHEASTTPPIPLRTLKTLSIRSAATGSRNNSDDNESVSSRQSITSNLNFVNRRVTRSTARNMNEIDDDSYSVASSTSSDRQFRLRYKDKKSPNTTLSSIPEDALDESVQEHRRRGTRATKQ